MPAPKHHDDQPRCDQCNAFGEYREKHNSYFCEPCAYWADDNLEEMDDADA